MAVFNHEGGKFMEDRASIKKTSDAGKQDIPFCDPSADVLKVIPRRVERIPEELATERLHIIPPIRLTGLPERPFNPDHSVANPDQASRETNGHPFHDDPSAA